MQVVLDVSAFQTPYALEQILANPDDDIVGIYIKATEGLNYTDQEAQQLVYVAQKHRIPFGYYDFMTNDQAAAQADYFKHFIQNLPVAELQPMMDAEGGYNLYAAGAQHWKMAYGDPALLYASVSNMAKYDGSGLEEWVAQYDVAGRYYRPSADEINSYQEQGYLLWQWTDSYMGRNQDASVLLGDFNLLRAA